jgi:uncharacterized membrane protein
MIVRTQTSAGLGALDAIDAVGWGWSSPVKPAPSRYSLLRTGLLVGIGLAGLAAAALLAGFLVFIYSLERSERPPAARTDGIVALTGAGMDPVFD